MYILRYHIPLEIIFNDINFRYIYIYIYNILRKINIMKKIKWSIIKESPQEKIKNKNTYFKLLVFIMKKWSKLF